MPIQYYKNKKSHLNCNKLERYKTKHKEKKQFSSLIFCCFLLLYEVVKGFIQSWKFLGVVEIVQPAKKSNNKLVSVKSNYTESIEGSNTEFK